MSGVLVTFYLNRQKEKPAEREAGRNNAWWNRRHWSRRLQIFMSVKNWAEVSWGDVMPTIAWDSQASIDIEVLSTAKKERKYDLIPCSIDYNNLLTQNRFLLSASSWYLSALASEGAWYHLYQCSQLFDAMVHFWYTWRWRADQWLWKWWVIPASRYTTRTLFHLK